MQMAGPRLSHRHSMAAAGVVLLLLAMPVLSTSPRNGRTPALLASVLQTVPPAWHQTLPPLDTAQRAAAEDDERQLQQPRARRDGGFGGFGGGGLGNIPFMLDECQPSIYHPKFTTYIVPVSRSCDTLRRVATRSLQVPNLVTNLQLIFLPIYLPGCSCLHARLRS